MNIGFILGNDTTTKLMLAIVLGPVLTTVIGMFGLRASKWALYLLVALPVLFAIPMLGGLSSMAIPVITQPLWDKTYGAGSFQGIVDLAHKSGFQDSTFAPSFSSNATIVAMTAPGWAASGVWSNTSAPAGELKEARKSVIYGLVIGIALIGVYMTSLVWLVFRSYTQVFVSQYVYVYQNADALENSWHIHRNLMRHFSLSLV